VTGFPALMLHPFVVPEQMLLVAGAALVAGRMETKALATAPFAFVAGMAAGKVGHLAMPALAVFWQAPLVAACLAGLMVAAFGSIRSWVGADAIFLLAFVLSVGLVPETPGVLPLVEAVVATALTGLAILVGIGLPLSRVRSGWGRVLVRVAGAWLAAVALLNLVLAWYAISGPAT